MQSSQLVTLALITGLLLIAVNHKMWSPKRPQIQTDVQSNVSKVNYTSVYQGQQNSDAFCSVAYLGNGICLAGKRDINRPSKQLNNWVYRSTDYCKSFYDVGVIKGNQFGNITGNHAYHFGYKDNVVCFGTGDSWGPTIQCSYDYGETWQVQATTTQINKITNSNIRSIYGIVYANNGNMLAALSEASTNITGNAFKILKSTDNGLTWSFYQSLASFSSAGNAIRKFYKKANGDLIACCYTPSAMYMSSDNGVTWRQLASTKNIPGLGGVFSFEDLGNGVYLMGDEQSDASLPIKIYRSIDYGQTWTTVYSVNLQTSLKYFRHIIKVRDDLIIAYASCSENPPWTARCAKQVISLDSGLTWIDQDNPFFNQYGGMNAVYDAAMIEDGLFFVGAQPDSNILIYDFN